VTSPLRRRSRPVGSTHRVNYLLCGCHDVTLVSAIATGFVNAFAHRERLGWVGATLLAALIMGFVEKFYFTLRHGLVTIYNSRKQRFAAKLCYRVIQATMILNATILCAWCTRGIKSITRQ
jgi:hypothetical protein